MSYLWGMNYKKTQKMNLDYKIIKLMTKALNMVPNSPKQLEIRKEIEILIGRKK